MYELLVQLQTYVRMVWRFRWLALVGATLICAGGWLAVYMMPDKYEVSTKVFLDTRSLMKPILKGLAIDSNVQQDTVSMMRRTLLARPNLESVARSTDMDLSTSTPEEFEALIIGLASSVKVSGGAGRDNIFNITYKDNDAQLATRVVESLLNIFVERSLGESRKDTSKTKEFIDQQIREYEAKLEAAEDRLKEFKRRNVGLMPGEGKTYYSQRDEAQRQLSNAQLELAEAKNRRDVLMRQLEGEEPTFGMMPAPSMQYEAAEFRSSLDGRIEKLQENLDNLLLQFTKKHPDVIASRHLLDDLIKRREKERRKYRAEQSSRRDPMQEMATSLAENPVFQEIKIAHGAAEAEVAALETRVMEYENRKAELEKLVDTIPKIEAELKALNRDYAVDRKNYDALVSRRESLKLSDEAGKTTDDVQFNIIEPPRVPIIPSSPNRPLLNAMVLAAGFGGGVAMALLFAMIRPSFYTKEDVVSFTDLPVLGVVARNSTTKEIFGRRVGYAIFVAGCLSLFLAYFVVLMTQGSGQELLNLFSSGRDA